MRGLTVTLTLPTPGFLSSPPGLRFHPFAHIGRESARRRWRADPTAGLGRSLPAAAARYRFRWPRRCAPRIWWSPPSPPAAASAPGRVRTGPAGLPEHACDAPREKTRCSRRPVQHPPETGRRDIGSTSNRGETGAPDLRSSKGAWSEFPGSGRDGHSHTATAADRPPELRIAAAGLRRRHLVAFNERICRLRPVTQECGGWTEQEKKRLLRSISR